MLQQILGWLVVSSADSTRVSATIQGILIQWIALGMIGLKLLGYHFTESQYYDAVGLIAGMIGTLYGLFGLLRKIYLSIRGTASTPF